MSTSRLLSLLAVAVLVVVAIFVVSGVASGSAANYALGKLDQIDRHPISAVSAEQARIDFRRGEWNAGNSISPALLDQFDRHANAAMQAYASGALDQIDRHSGSTSSAAFDVEQARLQWRAGK